MNRLIAERLAQDPRVSEAKRVLLEVLGEHRRQITTVRPADPALKASYRQMIEQFGQMRGGALFYPYLGSGIGNGTLVELADGSVKYDMITGIGVHVGGHSHERLAESGLDAALRDTVMQGNLQQNVESAELSRLLLDLAAENGAKLDHCLLTSSGAMANENALKLVFHKHHPAARLLAFERCFMGRTNTLAQITDKCEYRAGLPMNVAVDYVPYFDARKPKQSTNRALDTLNDNLARYPRQHAAMCFELVLGEGGYYPGDHDFFAALMAVLKQHEIAIIVDEIQTFGRTARPFAFGHFSLDRYVDVVTIGKLSQVCATLFAEPYRPPRGLVSQTFTGSTSAILAAQVILDELLAGEYFGDSGKIARFHERFAGHLRAIAARHPGSVSGPYGIGAMVAFTPYDGSRQNATRLVHELFEAGVIAFTAADGPSRVRFLMPILAIDDQDIDAVARILDDTIGQVKSGAIVDDKTTVEASGR